MGARYFCDGCGEVKSPADLKSYNYPCHFDAMIKGDPRVYVDVDMNPVSDRNISVDLCHACYNKVVLQAVKALKKLQEENAEKIKEML